MILRQSFSFVVRCGTRGEISEIVRAPITACEALQVGRQFAATVSAASFRTAMAFFVAIKADGIVRNWEMKMPFAHGRQGMTFSGVLCKTGIIIVASTSRDDAWSLLRDVMDRDAPACAEPASAPVNRDDALLEELSRFNNELTTMQRELAKKNRELQEQRIWLWNILSAIDDAVVAVDSGGIVTFMNRSAELLTGRDSRNGHAAPLEAVLPLKPSPQGTVHTPDFRDTWQGGRVQVIESTMIECAMGGVIPVSCFATPLVDVDGKAEGAVILVRDMTLIQRAQDLVVESERMTTAKGIAAGIAHAVNNILAVISVTMEVIVKDLPPDHRDHARNIRSSVQRAAELTARLLSFAESRASMTDPVDMNEIIRSAIVETSGSFSHISVVADCDPRPAWVLGDPARLSAAVTSLLTNACESIVERGNVRVTTRIDQPDGGLGDRGARLRIAIADDGAGMSAEVMSRIFTPFHSTKFLGRGLGLASARGIFRAHGGDISIESEEGHGTTVTGLLPLSGLTAPGAPAQIIT